MAYTKLETRKAGFMQASSILIVEDESTLQRILGSVLGDAGLLVDAVGSAEEALSHLENESVDLILSDKNLPGMSGLDLLREVRQDDPAKLFVLVTGYPSKESALDVLKYDGDGYLVKPFISLGKVVEDIQNTLSATHTKPPQKAAARQARKTTRTLLRKSENARSSLVGERCFLVIDDDKTKGVLIEALQARGAEIANSFADATLFFAARTDDIAAAHRSIPGCAMVLVDGTPHFSALVEFIDMGGGGVLDPSLVFI
ncbi:MAG: response regulator [Deltaproteobacteria bacterium]|nr:response regulator [Deltaproteobacteria bacterium]